MDPRKNMNAKQDVCSSSTMKKRKTQPNLHSFLAKRSTHVGAGFASSDVQKDVVNVSVHDTNVSTVANHVVESSAVNSVATGSNSIESQEVNRKSSRKWRNQWTLLHPWAYLCKSMTNEERIKCSYCEDAKKVNAYTQRGSSSIMISALRDHSITNDHKDAERFLKARKRLNDVGKGPLDDGMETIMHTEQERIITCMKIVYFCALEDIPLEKYQSHCRLLRELGTPNMPASEEYGSYVNAILKVV